MKNKKKKKETFKPSTNHIEQLFKIILRCDIALKESEFVIRTQNNGNCIASVTKANKMIDDLFNKIDRAN